MNPQEQYGLSVGGARVPSSRQPLDSAARSSAEWCFPEIQHAFEKVAQSLDEYVSGEPKEPALLEKASNQLHQGLGALRVMSPAGIDVVADTLERVFDVNLDPKIEWTAENVALAKRALAALTEYLEDLIDGQPEEPMLLFPHYKAMQLLSGQARLHPAELFQIPQDAKLLPDNQQVRTLGDDEKLKLRSEYETGLLKTLRSGINAQIAGDLRLVLEKVAQSPEGMHQYSFWRAAAAVFEAVAGQSLEVDLYVKRLVARLNAQLKETLAGGKNVSDQLFREVLFSLAMAKSSSPTIEVVRTAFQLQGSIPENFEESRFGLYDQDAERQARESIPAIKEAWDLVTQKKIGALAKYAEAVSSFHAAASLLGAKLSELGTTWIQIGRAIEGKPEALTEGLAVEMATSVLFVESLFSGRLKRYPELGERCEEMVSRLQACYAGREVSAMPDWLATLSREAQERSTMTVFIHEAKAGVRVAEEGVDLFLRDLKDTSRLGEASASLAQIAGALMLLGQEVPSQAARHLSSRIAGLQSNPVAPSEDEQELLASSMGALALFVDSLAQNIDQEFVFDEETGEFGIISGEGDDQDVVEVVLGTSIPDKKKRHRLLKKASKASSQEKVPSPAVEVAAAPAEQIEMPVPVLVVAQALVAAPQPVTKEEPSRVDPLDDLDDVAPVTFDFFDVAPSGSVAEPVAALPESVASVEPVAVAPVQAQAEPKPEPLSEDDLELREIFIFEALEVLEAIEHAGSGLKVNASDNELMTIVRRGFHTLKGSSRMVRMSDYGDAAWAMEQLLNHYLSAALPADEAFVSLVNRSRVQFMDWTQALQENPHFQVKPQAMIDEALVMREGVPQADPVAQAPVEQAADVPAVLPVLAAAASGVAAFAAPSAPVEDMLSEVPPLPVAEQEKAQASELQAFWDADAQQLGEDDAKLFASWGEPKIDAPEQEHSTSAGSGEASGEMSLDAEIAALLDDMPEHPAVPVASVVPESGSADQFALEVPADDFFGGEALVSDAMASDAIAQPAPAQPDLAESFAAREPDLGFTAASLSSPVEQEVVTPEVFVADLQPALLAGALALPALAAVSMPVEPVRVAQPVVEAVTETATDSVIEPVTEAVTEVAPEDSEIRIGERTVGRQLYQIFVEEAQGILATLDADLEDWAHSSRPASEVGIRGVHSLKGSSCLVGLFQINLIAERLEQFMLVTQRESVPAVPAEVTKYALALEGVRKSVADFAKGIEPGEQLDSITTASQLYDECVERTSTFVRHENAGPQAASTPEAKSNERLKQDLALQRKEELDEDLLPLFVDEARDYLPQIGENLRAISKSLNDRALQQLAMRQLHTVKGSARMAGAMTLGNRVHDMETKIESAIGLTNMPSQIVDALIEEYDDVVVLFEAVQMQGFEDLASAPAAEADASTAAQQAAADTVLSAVPEHDAAASEAAHAALSSNSPDAVSFAGVAATTLAGAAVATVAALPALKPFAKAAEAPVAPAAQVAPAQANIRVRADMLDRVVNEAGEVAIVRSRTENSMASLRTSIMDLTENVSRLRGQLREIEIQAEVQMQAQIAHARESHNFDPLEYDRYTRFQELTRMLAESVNDVATVQQNVNKTIEKAGLDLNRQGQLMRDLQQNLMRMRMVAFGSIGERLYRIVRQASKELGKRVNLDVRGGATELDRNVLERMSAPIEHLLRNSVAHGIESPEERAHSGKLETGEVVVSVRQDGNEVVLSFKDDGAGLNLSRIRAKAIERGIISEFDELTDSAVADLIFTPGFSTATEVSQISGRGVGMDVVRTEVQSLGGRIDTATSLGFGTEFSIYLPLTLAVTQVVIVKVGEHRFAIPSGSVEQVMQLKAQPLVSAYEAQSVQWLNQKIPMQYFGSLLDMADVSPVAQHYSPIIIARTGPHRVAVHVDEVVGNEEVVVKNVGSQVARVPGIAGATVLGDGEIVLIINPVALAQKQDRGVSLQVMGDFAARASQRALIEAPPSVLVVDDSLTVRKVTQRLLTREGYEVILAKDGVDALKQLQERVPDVVLSDIEMPRMDGFDLVRNIRGDIRLAHLPIVMISSRTADKHQNYAKTLGVNAFLGKPYSEETLLGLLSEFTADHRARKLAAIL